MRIEKSGNKGLFLSSALLNFLAFDEYIESVTILPPSQWDSSIRIEPPTISAESKEERKRKQSKVHKHYLFLFKPGKRTRSPFQATRSKALEASEADQKAKDRENSGLVRSGRLFGGLVNDIKRKGPL